MIDGVSFIIPVYNGERTIKACIKSALAQTWKGETEVIVVDDASADRTLNILLPLPVTIITGGKNVGAAAATNVGMKRAKYEIVVSLDSDAVLKKDWLEKILPRFDAPEVGAVAGYIATGNTSIMGRLAGYHLEWQMEHGAIFQNQLSTTNTAYRASLLKEVGYFNESMRIGYDVDMSHRIKRAGYTLILENDARCTHFWKDTLWGYLKQEYNYGLYNAENLSEEMVKTAPSMVFQGLITGVVLMIAGIDLFLLACGNHAVNGLFMLLVLSALPLFYLPEGISVWKKKKEWAVVLLPFLLALRNIMRLMAFGVGTIQKLRRGV